MSNEITALIKILLPCNQQESSHTDKPYEHPISCPAYYVSDVNTAYQRLIHYKNITLEELEKQIFNTRTQLLCCEFSLDNKNQLIKKLKDNLTKTQSELANRCKTCGAITYCGPPDCFRCGAPNCCPQCCKIDALEHRVKELEMMKSGSEILFRRDKFFEQISKDFEKRFNIEVEIFYDKTTQSNKSRRKDNKTFNLEQINWLYAYETGYVAFLSEHKHNREIVI